MSDPILSSLVLFLIACFCVIVFTLVCWAIRKYTAISYIVILLLTFIIGISIIKGI